MTRRLQGARVGLRRRPAAAGLMRGFTLIELLIAAALLAVLAVLAWRGLDTVLAARQRIVTASDTLRGLTLAVAQLDDDVRRSWPVRALGLAEPTLSFERVGESGEVVLKVVREAGLMTEPTRVQRVMWRVRAGVLERGLGPVQPPPVGAAPPAQPGDERAWVWQPLLSGVQSWSLQAWRNDVQTWLPAQALVGAPPESTQGRPGVARTGITGVRVELRQANGSTVTRLLSVRD